MAPTALRLQIVRGLASLTESTPAEIESLFELSKPVSVVRRAPPRQGRPKPVGLELQMLRILVSHPQLAQLLNDEALASFDYFGQESADALRHLVHLAQSLGEYGTFAALSQQLKEVTGEYDSLISEIAAEPESDLDADRIWLLSAVRQIKMDALKQELNQLFSSGLTPDQVSTRYREIVAQQELLAREDTAAMTPR
jgi:DNA primase